MTLPGRRSSQYHQYYSDHAEPMENMLRAHTLKSKSSYNINQNQWPALTNNTNKLGSRWTLAPESTGQVQEKKDRRNNTYYNNMIMYINNKNGDNDSTMSAMKARQNMMKSRESLYSTMLREPLAVPERKEAEDCSACRQCDSCCDSFCCSFWSCVLVIIFLAAGFASGVVAGAVWQRNGFLYEMGQKFPAINHITDYYSNQFNRADNNINNHYKPNYNNYNNYYSGQLPPQPPQYPSDRINQNQVNSEGGRTRVILPGRTVIIQGDSHSYLAGEVGGQPKVLIPGVHSGMQGIPGTQGIPGMPGMQGMQGMQGMPGPNGYDPRCMYRWSNMSNPYVQGSCSLCAAAKVINVTGAGYADCSGLYTISNLTSIWDSKRIVFERIAGGWRPMDKRYIYWNAHFFGESFYGWSIGDRQSLVESGPFHSQGRAGASTHPWQGSWKGNVSIQLVNCNVPRPTIRWNSQTMDELQRMREREREMNLRRNMHQSQPMDGGVYLNP